MITRTIDPVSHDLSQFEMRRVLPSKERNTVEPFTFVDEFVPGDLVEAGLGVRLHPHINLTTRTSLFDGTTDHL